ncbi:MAG TPA: hypothetical protein VNZ85_15375 [Caulobacter sp.]|nr:hypothetical protein [Caulobacter sp.]
MNGFSYFRSLNGAVSVAAPVQTLGDTQDGRALAETLATAASSFEIVNGRAVQVVDMHGRNIAEGEV